MCVCVCEIVKYKERQEQEDPGKPWDGHVPAQYCVTLEDGTKANVGAWMNCRKRDRKNRLRNGFEEKSLAEERLDAIGILWEARARIEVDEHAWELWGGTRSAGPIPTQLATKGVATWHCSTIASAPQAVQMVKCSMRMPTRCSHTYYELN